jgi:hypothetical protein
MVQILPANSFGSQFGRAIGSGLGQGFAGGMESADQKRQLAQEETKKNKLINEENEQIKNELGIDLSGILSPEMRKAYVAEHLRGLNKQRQQQDKQDFLTNLFNGKEPSDQSDVGNKLSGTQQGAFDPSKLSDQDIAKATAVDPSMGNSLRAAKDSALRQQEKTPERQREQRIATAQAEADVKYNQTLQEASKQHELKRQTLDRLKKLNAKGVTGKPYEKILEKAGLVALTSDGRREFAGDVKNLITDIRSILGAQFTGFEFQTILNAYPSADFSQGANEAIINNIESFQDIKEKEVEFAEKLKKENGGKIPEDFQAKVNEKVREYAASKMPEIKENTRKIMAEEYGITPGNVLMLDPQGEPLDVPPNEVERYQSFGATFP